MSTANDPINQFYLRHLPGAVQGPNVLQAPCPFCGGKQNSSARLVVITNKESHFHGYFRCLNRCTPGGFALHFARLLSIPLIEVPGYEPDREYFGWDKEYPAINIDQEIIGFRDKLTPEILKKFQKDGVSADALNELRIGYNGRYLVYPYFQANGSCYSARCVHPDKPEDSFWYGNEQLFKPEFQIFNIEDIERCENGSLFLMEGERNLAIIKQLGFPGVALPQVNALEQLDPAQFRWINTLYVVVSNTIDAESRARSFATRTGFKVRILQWPDNTPKTASLHDLAAADPVAFPKMFAGLMRNATAFSPFTRPDLEYRRFSQRLSQEKEGAYQELLSGFPLLDEAIGGIHGINILGGTPKAGKSTFFIQIAAEMAQRKIPVIYYDFENGRQKIYLRILSRLSRLSTEAIRKGPLTPEEQKRLALANKSLEESLHCLRVVNDRKLSPETMRRHVDFIRLETKTDYTVVVVDSLHKLPFKDISQKRSGIDGWLRQLEAIRDEQGVSFLVISELERGQDGQFEQQPQLGSFKGSGDIGYSADNALVLTTQWDPFEIKSPASRINDLWLVASREHSPGKIAEYQLDYPFWGFLEKY